jgi:hypothetical protein
MQRMRKYLHLTVIFSMMMTLVAVAFPATVGAANLSITPQSWDFGNVEAGTTSPHREFTVNNTDSPAVTINNVTMFAGGGQFDITANGCLNAVLQNGESCVFSVVFEPDGLGDVQGTVEIEVAGNPDSFVTVSGSGTNPVLTYAAAPGGNPPGNFGDVQIGDTSVQKVITITNTGDEEVQFVSPIFSTNSPEFTVESGGSSGFTCALNIPLAPDASCTVRVTFQPQNGLPGARNGGLAILYTTEGGFVTSSFALQGMAVLGELTAAPNPVDFGNVLAGPPTAPISVTLTNSGIGPLRLDGTTIVGANSGMFELITGSDNCSNTTLAPGGTCTVQVRFNSGAGASATPKAASLRFDVQSGANGPYPAGQFDVPLQANVVSGVLSVSPSAHTFADRQIGTWSAPVTFTVTNNSPGPIEITDLDETGPNAASFDVLDQTCEDVTLQAGQSCTFQVAFTPVGASGQKNNTIFIEHSGSNGASDLEVNVSGLALDPILGFSGNGQLNFPDTQVGTASAPMMVTLTNNGTGPLDVDTITPAPAAQFDVVGDLCSGTTLPAGANCTFWVVFSPPAATPVGNKLGTLTIAHSGNADPLIMQLQGNAVTGTLSVSPAPVNFGGVVINTLSAPQLVTITNTGPGPLGITAVTAPAPFNVVNNNCDGQSLGAGDSCTVQVTFAPTALGFDSDNLVIAHDGAGSPTLVSLTGIGVNAPQLTVTPAGPVDFGDVIVDGPGGNFALRAFTVTNPGVNPVVFAAPTFTGTGFSLESEDCPASIGPGESCTVVVRFDPIALGAHNGTMTINPIIILMGMGVGANGALDVNTPQLTFGPQQIGSQSTTQAVIVSNNGNVAITLDTPAVTLSGNDYVIAGGAGATCQDGLVLDPGESCILWVAFQPNGPPGDINEILTIDYSSTAVADGTLIVLLRGIATTPNGMVAPLQLDFGAQEILTTSGPQTVTFTNTGTGTIVVPVVTLAGPHANQYLIQSDSCSGASVLSGATCTISVVFRPTSTGAKNAQLAVGALPNSDVVTLKGVGVDPLLVVSPSGPVDFGSVIADGAGGYYSLRAFTFTNTGSNDMPIPVPTFTGPFGFEAGDCVFLTPLGPGASCTIVVRFDPSTVGPQNGTMVVNPVVVLMGMGVAPSGALSVSPPQLTFGPQQIGTQSQTQQIIVSNNGNIPVTIGTVAVVGGDYILANGAGNTCQDGIILGAGESCTLWVAFLPGGPPGPKNSQVDITYSSAAVAAGTVSVLLRGNAITPNGSVSPQQLDFGIVEVGTTSNVQTVTFTNIGTEIIVVPPVTLGGPDAGEYLIQSDACSGASVLAGATCEISVVFRPTSAGAKNAQLQVGALPNPDVVTLKGIGLDATISVTPLDWDFGFVVVNQTSIKAFTVTNNGSNPVVIGAPAFAGSGDFSLLSETCSAAPLGPGASCTVVVQFMPSSIGPKHGTMTVGPVVVTLHGTGVLPSGALSANPVQLTFGNVQVGAMSTTQQITFSNTGTIPVSLTSLPGLNGPNSGDFLLTVAGNTCQIGIALNPGESCVVSVAFRPTAPGNREAWVSLTYTSASVPNGVISVLLRGVGLTPVVSVSPNQLVFGPQSLNTASAAKTVVVTNMSTGPITLGGLGLGGANAGDFQLVGDLCTNSTLAAGATCQFSVVFLPTSSTGPKNATVIVPVIGLSNVIVNLSGQAIAAQQGGLSFSPAFHDFGYVQVGSPTAPRPVTVTNNGTAVLTISNIAFLGPDAADFFPLIADDCEGKSLNPGQSCTVWVRYRPLTTGTSEAYLTYFTDLAGSPHAVALYGVGISPVLTISPIQLNFGNLQVGSVSAPYSVTVTNSSNGPITLDLTGPFTGDFELVGQLCDDNTLAPGGTCTFSITFRPQSTGVQTDEVDIDIEPGAVDFEVDLVGVGTTPNGMISPLQLDFGAVQVGFTSNVQTVRFTNIGTGPISVPPVNLAGPDFDEFLIQTDSCSNAVVPSGQWCEVSVVFRPQTQGPKNAQLSIAPLHNPDVVTLKGFGSVPSPAFNAAAVDFGTQPLLVESTPRRVTVTNNGGGVLLLFGMPTIAGPDAADFSIKVSTCNDAQLDPGESCYVDVTFKPLPPLGPDPDIRTAWIEFLTNMPTAIQMVPLTGQVGQFNVNVVTGANACLSVTLSPMGPYAGTDEVTATATVAASDVFIGWILDGYYVGFANPLDFKMKNSSHTLEAICVAKPTFSDIGGSPYTNEIELMAAHGFLKGYFGLSGPYGPDDDVLRSQMAVIITRMAQRTNGWNSETPANPFTDQCSGTNGGCVDPESWNAVAVGYQKQVIRGVGFGLFAPFSPVTEIQVVAFTSRTLIATTHELENRGRYPACPDPSIPAPPIATVSPCATPPNFLTGQEGVYPATKWEQQLDNVTIYGDVNQASGHRVDISTYYYYVGGVPGPTGSTIGPASAWPTWTTAADREQVAAIMWWAFADYWGTDRIDELP